MALARPAPIGDNGGMTTTRATLALALLLSASACKDAGAPAGAGSASAPATAATVAADGTAVAEIAVTAKGFEPARVEVAGGKPVLLKFTRKVEATCADAVEVQGDPVRHVLPLNRTVEVKVTPPASGQVAFACPMKMIQGAVVVLPR
ncbi:MAG: hypothetical protein NVSMB23_08060 [Myxococcales bacterium]